MRPRVHSDPIAIREPGIERGTMNTTVQSGHKRAVVAEAEDTTYHRKGWYEPVEAPNESICPRCRRSAPYVVWRKPDWLCPVCADN